MAVCEKACQYGVTFQMRGGNKVTYAAGVWLDVDAPLSGIEVEGLEGTLLAEDLELVDVLVAAVVTGVGKTLRVLVGEDGAVGLHGGPAGQILREKIRGRGRGE